MTYWYGWSVAIPSALVPSLSTAGSLGASGWYAAEPEATRPPSDRAESRLDSVLGAGRDFKPHQLLALESGIWVTMGSVVIEFFCERCRAASPLVDGVPSSYCSGCRQYLCRGCRGQDGLRCSACASGSAQRRTTSGTVAARRAVSDVKDALTDLARLRPLLEEGPTSSITPGSPWHEWQLIKTRVASASHSAETALQMSRNRQAASARKLQGDLTFLLTQADNMFSLYSVPEIEAPDPRPPVRSVDEGALNQGPGSARLGPAGWLPLAGAVIAVLAVLMIGLLVLAGD